MTDRVLEVNDLCKSFGGVQAIRDLSFGVAPGEVMGLIGPNGSGKSTTVNALAGVFPATSGQIMLGGAPVQDMSEHARVAMGLARTFQTASNFAEFTVREQVMLGGAVTLKAHPLASVFGLGHHAREEDALRARVHDILDLTGLAPVAEQTVGTISSAQQRFLMIATALAAAPRILLLDEPAAGLVSHERKMLADTIKAIRDRGTAVLVIEHHMALIMEVCDRIVVLNFGSKIAEGTPSEIRNDRAVIDAYLGEAV
ncbi:ABC transporter ATP-binding protein [Seohaeicola saemankumensis]|uniref:ABC transporter ATP-binding protein n=1 Tax=Seohaeicola TaxID=481178 RepID=UPI0035D01FEA